MILYEISCTALLSVLWAVRVQVNCVIWPINRVESLSSLSLTVSGKVVLSGMLQVAAPFIHTCGKTDLSV